MMEQGDLPDSLKRNKVKCQELKHSEDGVSVPSFTSIAHLSLLSQATMAIAAQRTLPDDFALVDSFLRFSKPDWDDTRSAKILGTIMHEQLGRSNFRIREKADWIKLAYLKYALKPTTLAMIDHLERTQVRRQ